MSIQKFNPSRSKNSLQTSGFLKHENHSYTNLPNKVLQNCKNLEALALWCHLQSRPENWLVSPQNIQNHFGIGRDKVSGILRYLIEVNLLEVVRQKDENGRFGASFYIVKNGDDFISEDYEEGKSDVTIYGFPVTGKPTYGFPVTGKHTTTKERVTKKRINKKNRDKYASIMEKPVDNFSVVHDKKPMEAKFSSVCFKNSFKKLELIPENFEPDDDSQAFLRKTAERVKMPANDLLSKFILVMSKYKARSDNWQNKFCTFLDNERIKRTFEDISGKLRRYDGGPLHY